MYKKYNFKTVEFVVGTFAILFVLLVYGAIPFFTLPTLGQAVWTTGFSQSMANGQLFDFYARDIGIPRPASIAFGLAGAWPASLLIRLGINAADAYTIMAASWLGLAMFAAYRLARRFGATKLLALVGSVIWMTSPIIWGHVGYSMLSFGIALLSFYFLAAFNLFLIHSESTVIKPTAILLYVFSAVVSVFMDGYTFMMFACAASFLLIYSYYKKPELRSTLIKVAAPVHFVSFSIAYILYSSYIGKLNFDPSPIDFFRGWGLDLSFLVVPTKGRFWIADLLGVSVPRTNELYFGDSSTWKTTFALPIILFGVYSWWRVRNKIKIATGIILISLFGFYMALGPSLKVNSTKPEELQLSHPREQSVLMRSEYAIAPTGNAWIYKYIPGFNVMRASYRWSALGIFSLWILIMIAMSSGRGRAEKVWLGISFALILINLPNLEKRWRNGVDQRLMFHHIDRELVADLNKNIVRDEVVAFLPWDNDFIVNYLAPKVGFRTFNIGGDKNLAAAQSIWPQEMLSMGGEFDSVKAMSSLTILLDSVADVIVIPYFDKLRSAHVWPCLKKTGVRLTDAERDSMLKSGGFLCLSERKSELHNTIAAFRSLPYVDVVETDLFVAVRLRPDFSGRVNRLELMANVVGDVQYPISIEPGFSGSSYILQKGWHDIENKHVWSKSDASLLLPMPKYCDPEKCEAKLVFGAFGASENRPVDILFNSAEDDWEWSEKITAYSGQPLAINIPFSKAVGLRSIHVSIPNATSPQRLIGSHDARVIGVSLQRIEIVNE
ncbi:hypothetical protein Maes01_02252 [Microbulbifer aestuariivivens]|uniref:Glycosyltransferase RgtA/B/C/D-like domain-containing protein n=1 Tax=Microbulbifer aestuariivivens TaxID=1908308 RepID=A0ABP9WR55_9GAMM